MRRGAVCLASLLLALPAAAESLTLFAGDPSGWEYQTFDDIAETRYEQTVDEEGRAVLKAVSAGGASGYTRMLDISLDETPWLHFRWRVDAAAANDAEQTRAGDDFAWRLYFVGKSGLQYRSLNLVYSRNSPAGRRWESPYSGMLRDLQIYAAAAHDEAALGQWQTTAINVGELWRQTFDDEGAVGLIGLMTDGDNRGVTMQATYGDIVLSERPPGAD